MRKRGKPILIYLNKEEKDKFLEIFGKSGESSLSDLARKLLLGQPVRIYYRDRAFDDFIEAAIDFRKDASLILQRPDWDEEEKTCMKTLVQEMHDFHVKIYDYVRNSKQNKKRS